MTSPNGDPTTRDFKLAALVKHYLNLKKNPQFPSCPNKSKIEKNASWFCALREIRSLVFMRFGIKFQRGVGGWSKKY